jgi:hypothetical protein
MLTLDAASLPADWKTGTFAARVMTPEGPIAVGLIEGAAFDMTPAFGTVSAWFNAPDPRAAIRARGVPMVLDLPAVLAAAGIVTLNRFRGAYIATLDRKSFEELLRQFPKIRDYLDGLSDRRLKQIGEAMRPVEILDADELVVEST